MGNSTFRFLLLALLALPVLQASAPASSRAFVAENIAPPVALHVSQELQGLDAELERLKHEDLQELLDFVAGNTLFTLYHEAGHMLISELELPVLGQEEDAVDNLATVTMLGADTEDMDLLLSHAMIGWFLIASENYEDLVFYSEHDLDQQRGYQMLCLMVGADEAAFADLARDLELPEERLETCGFDYEQSADSWEIVTAPYLREDGERGNRIRVRHGPPGPGQASMALFLKESELMEIVAEELDDLYKLPEQVTFKAEVCGEENAFWDPSQREMTLCYELMTGFADIYLDLLTLRN
ncbi:putative metallopeptidase DUF4344 [Roseibium hamelinense]|uniref:Putative metallopeptidase DUF4344 n=1 Tax=Roseibium hamelinense TaxID=150831 RepID=A0A562THV9_9HYPH|nr:DUF4344 domain-containing metallopeptidase [Roseibium hamelinense]MTI42304.1 hypothetical protein [Roseibium hamelinense]TWI93225.1 putative metallopeptidase DUF4344 [Roseibium hamelinense]